MATTPTKATDVGDDDSTASLAIDVSYRRPTASHSVKIHPRTLSVAGEGVNRQALLVEDGLEGDHQKFPRRVWMRGRCRQWCRDCMFGPGRSIG